MIIKQRGLNRSLCFLRKKSEKERWKKDVIQEKMALTYICDTGTRVYATLSLRTVYRKY